MSHLCSWTESDPLMTAYHDEEWGVPVKDSRTLWEMLILEGFQAGLSWSTILKRREGFRKDFEGFDPEIVDSYGEKEIERLLADPGIIRSRAKIQATIRGAKTYLDMREKGENFSDWAWSFTEGKPLKGDGVTVPAKTHPRSAEYARARKKRIPINSI